MFEEINNLLESVKSSELTKKERDALPDEDFGLPGQRKYPIHDPEHVHSAISYFYKCPEKDRHELAANIKRKADEFGIEIHDTTLVYKYLPKEK